LTFSKKLAAPVAEDGLNEYSRTLQKNPRKSEVGAMGFRWNSVAVTAGSLLVLTACSSFPLDSIPKGTVAGVSAGLGALLSGPTGALIAGTLGSISGDMMIPESASSQSITGFWPLLGELLKVSGWLLALVIVIPWVMGWLTDVPWRKKK